MYALDFDEVMVQLFPDLFPQMLHQCCLLKPLLDYLRVKGATYCWGYPPSLSIKKDNLNYICFRHVSGIMTVTPYDIDFSFFSQMDIQGFVPPPITTSVYFTKGECRWVGDNGNFSLTCLAAGMDSFDSSLSLGVEGIDIYIVVCSTSPILFPSPSLSFPPLPP